MGSRVTHTVTPPTFVNSFCTTKGISCSYVPHEWGIPVFIGTLSFGAVAHESNIPLWKLPREITHYINVQRAFCRKEKSYVFCCCLFFVMDRRRLSKK